MAWVTPIVDRALSDITGRTSKGFFNVADWERIDGNTAVIKAMLDTAGYLNIPLTSLTPPTITTIPVVADINPLIANIVRLQVAACLPLVIGLHVLFYSYIGGANQTVPDYVDVNNWEENQSIIYDSIPKAISYFIPCGVAASGQPRLWQHRFR